MTPSKRGTDRKDGHLVGQSYWLRLRMTAGRSDYASLRPCIRSTRPVHAGVTKLCGTSRQLGDAAQPGFFHQNGRGRASALGASGARHLTIPQICVDQTISAILKDRCRLFKVPARRFASKVILLKTVAGVTAHHRDDMPPSPRQTSLGSGPAAASPHRPTVQSVEFRSPAVDRPIASVAETADYRGRTRTRTGRLRVRSRSRRSPRPRGCHGGHDQTRILIGYVGAESTMFAKQPTDRTDRSV
jgi:hypothetical protein